jgi:hypothetical protein
MRQNVEGQETGHHHLLAGMQRLESESMMAMRAEVLPANRSRIPNSIVVMVNRR